MKACLTISVNYGDLLHYTLPRMLANFDRVLVVTDEQDEETREVVKQHGGELYATNSFYANNSPFNKGRATRQGINRLGLNSKDWLALVDSDIFLQQDIREHLRFKARKTLHGCIRRMCKRPAAWRQYLRTGSLAHINKKHNDQKHKIIVGYFQFFSMYGFHHFFPKGYPVPPRRTTAYMIDLDFAKVWSRHEWLPFDCIHLGPEKLNWAGRKSERFHARDTQEAP